MTDQIVRDGPDAPERRLGDVQRLAFERLESAIRAVPPNALHPMNVQPLAAASLILRALPRCMALRSRMASLDGVDLWLIDNCGALAHAYAYASSAYVVHGSAPSLPALRSEAVQLRKRLGLELARLTSPSDPWRPLTPLRNTMSYAALTHDLTLLKRAFDARWAELGPLTRVVTPTDLQRAGVLSVLLLERTRIQDELKRPFAEARLLAHQAFTLLCAAYEEVRAAVTLLRRHEGDADKIAPSIYQRKRKKAPTRPVEQLPAAPRKRPSARRAVAAVTAIPTRVPQAEAAADDVQRGKHRVFG